MRSFIGRVNYTLFDKYLFEFNFRSDGSSRFAKGHQWGFFPSAAVGWRVSEEAFFAPLKKAISNAKFRASYGSLGNNSGVGRYEQKETMGTTNYIVGNNGLATGFSANKMINQDLSWGRNPCHQYRFGLRVLQQPADCRTRLVRPFHHWYDSWFQHIFVINRLFGTEYQCGRPA